MKAEYLQAKHQSGLRYPEYVSSGTLPQQENWNRIYHSVQLSQEQHGFISSFVRKINVIGLSGLWCGDCVQQCPLIQRIAEANPQKIDLRWLDRDEHMDLQDHVRINGGNRVPIMIFCAEDYEMVGWFGDRTLSCYRLLAAKQLGACCPLPGAAVSKEELEAVLSDWLDQFERIHWILRLSARLRKRYND